MMISLSMVHKSALGLLLGLSLTGLSFMGLSVLLSYHALAQSPKLLLATDLNRGMTQWHEYDFETVPDYWFEIVGESGEFEARARMREILTESQKNREPNPGGWFMYARLLLNQHKFPEAMEAAGRALGQFDNYKAHFSELNAILAYGYIFGPNYNLDIASIYVNNVKTGCESAFCPIYNQMEMVLRQAENEARLNS